MKRRSWAFQKGYVLQYKKWWRDPQILGVLTKFFPYQIFPRLPLSQPKSWITQTRKKTNTAFEHQEQHNTSSKFFLVSFKKLNKKICGWKLIEKKFTQPQRKFRLYQKTNLEPDHLNQVSASLPSIRPRVLLKKYCEQRTSI